MTIGSLYTKSVATVRRDASAEEAAHLMREQHVGALVVIDPADSGAPVGVITDRDIVIEAVGQGIAPATVNVSSLMSSPVVTVREEAGVLEALSKMAARGVRRAPIVDRDGRLKGLASIDDLLPLIAQELARISVLINREQRNETLKTEDLFRDEFAT
jgi:CBS domain-containing protein